MNSYKPWHLAVIENAGYGNTSTAVINRVAGYLAKYGSHNIGNDEFIEACYACNADPYSFSQKDLERLQEKLNRLT